MTDPRYDPPPYNRDERVSLSGLTEAEAREFHKFFTMSFIAFLVLALIAHGLTYAFAPWGVNM